MDLIDRREAMAELYDVFFDDDLKAAYPDKADVVLDVIRKLPSALTDEKRTEKRTETHACDCISRQAAITAIQKAYADTEGGTDKCAVWKNVGLTNALHIMQDLPSAQPASYRQVTGKLDCISRQEAIDAINSIGSLDTEEDRKYARSVFEALPPARPEQTDCEYCHEDSDGYVRPIEKNCHAVIFGSVLYLKAEGWRGEVEIKYCPMCGRRLER